MSNVCLMLVRCITRKNYVNKNNLDKMIPVIFIENHSIINFIEMIKKADQSEDTKLKGISVTHICNLCLL